ncbi:hypothetical protein DSAG12_01458 [Promethearchaeum syntrophicum]|uniref:Uncharacterized protein n=1 Tax=Promethearchaeum syntrophicum TaxID=2594042 RepID=A0A5B9D954_9ARCH|nr:hypothetical protein [Candidatus Prometheoarchaeum syntrophicum]QEE15632.1 hypothetical protein DSAG12_01458 [Candidatus Prometheoarchaeum syntrophicum]
MEITKSDIQMGLEKYLKESNNPDKLLNAEIYEKKIINQQMTNQEIMKFYRNFDKVISPYDIDMAIKSINDFINHNINPKEIVFKYDIPAIFEYYKKSSKHQDILKRLKKYDKIFNGDMTVQKIIEYYPDLHSRYDIDVIKKSLDGFITYSIGIMYEEFRYKILKKHFPKVIWGKGGKSVPDFKITQKNGDVIFESTKILDFSNKIKILFKHHNREIQSAKEYMDETGFEPKVRVHIFNKYNNKIYVEYIPQEVIVSDITLTNENYHIFKVDEFYDEHSLRTWIKNYKLSC